MALEVPSKVPEMDSIGAAAERRIADAERFVSASDRPELEEIRKNMQRLAEAGGESQETEGEPGSQAEVVKRCFQLLSHLFNSSF